MTHPTIKSHRFDAAKNVFVVEISDGIVLHMDADEFYTKHDLWSFGQEMARRYEAAKAARDGATP